MDQRRRVISGYDVSDDCKCLAVHKDDDTGYIYIQYSSAVVGGPAIHTAKEKTHAAVFSSFSSSFSQQIKMVSNLKILIALCTKAAFFFSIEFRSIFNDVTKSSF